MMESTEARQDTGPVVNTSSKRKESMRCAGIRSS